MRRPDHTHRFTYSRDSSTEAWRCFSSANSMAAKVDLPQPGPLWISTMVVKLRIC